MTEVIGLNQKRAKEADDNRLWSSREMLEDSAREVQDHESAMAIMLDRTDNGFSVRFKASNITGAEMLAAIECAKKLILDSMDY